jgi:hypothetical protein
VRKASHLFLYFPKTFTPKIISSGGDSSVQFGNEICYKQIDTPSGNIAINKAILSSQPMRSKPEGCIFYLWQV